MHKDLKPENILLKNKKDLESIKIIDFGISQKFGKNKMTLGIGTPYYIAPEVLARSYDQKIDIWSVAVIMFYLLSGTHPFEGENDDEIMEKVKSGDYEYEASKWEGVSEEAKDLIDKMLVLDADKRISAQEALDHEWFKHYEEDNIGNEALSGAIDSLKEFKVNQKMQQATLTYIVTHMVTSEDTEALDEIFKQLDTDNNGKLSLDELKQGCEQVYPEMTEAQITKLLKKIDLNQNGTIEYSEWIAATVNKKQLLKEENLKEAFKTFDEDKDGYISADELKSLLGKKRNIDIEVCEAIIDEADEDEDGKLNLDEFTNMMDDLAEKILLTSRSN